MAVAVLTHGLLETGAAGKLAGAMKVMAGFGYKKTIVTSLATGGIILPAILTGCWVAYKITRYNVVDTPARAHEIEVLEEKRRIAEANAREAEATAKAA